MATKVSLIDGAAHAKEVTVADGGTEPTAGIDLGQNTLCGVLTPAGFDGSTLTFKMSDTLDGTYVPCTNTAPSTIAASTYISLTPSEFAGVRYIKPVLSAQSGDTVLKLMLRAM